MFLQIESLNIFRMKGNLNQNTQFKVVNIDSDLQKQLC